MSSIIQSCMSHKLIHELMKLRALVWCNLHIYILLLLLATMLVRCSSRKKSYQTLIKTMLGIVIYSLRPKISDVLSRDASLKPARGLNLSYFCSSMVKGIFLTWLSKSYSKDIPCSKLGVCLERRNAKQRNRKKRSNRIE